MTPRLVTPPAGAIVPLNDMRAHLRVLHNDEDALISSMIDAATAYLDGWRGVLGRCVLAQTWAVDYPCGGCWRLPFPDVETVTASAGTATLSHDSLGSIVELSEAATVTMVIRMPAELLPSVQVIVKLLVGHWYANREAVSGDAKQSVPMSVDALLTPIRWTRV